MHSCLSCAPPGQKNPSGHSKQGSDPELVLYVPGTQGVQRPGDSATHSILYPPAAQPPQAAQVPSESPPQLMRYAPGAHARTASHGSHAAVPVVVLYLPATHASQLPATPGTHPMRFWPGGQTPQNSQTPGPEVPAHPFRTCPVGQDSQLMQTDEPVVRAQRQITSQIHMHMYICIEDVCVCVPIFIMYVCIICMNECMHVYTHTHNDL